MLKVIDEAINQLSQDHEEAACRYRAAAKQGEMSEQNSLGLLYDDGSGVAQDAHNLGLAHLRGRRTGINKDEALIWLRWAAENGREGSAFQVEEPSRTPPTPHHGDCRQAPARTPAHCPRPAHRSTLVNDLVGSGFLAQQRNAVLAGGTGNGETSLATARSCIRSGARGRFYNVVVNCLEIETATDGRGVSLSI